MIANLANTCGAPLHSLPDLNWVGFYLLKDGELVVGPFQGKPACVRIALGKGVCGTAAARRATVDRARTCTSSPATSPATGVEFGDRGAADARDGELLGVLDLDSPKFARFDERGSGGIWKSSSPTLLKAI